MDKVLYCEVVCNYLNNLKGYIEDYESDYWELEVN